MPLGRGVAPRHARDAPRREPRASLAQWGLRRSTLQSTCAPTSRGANARCQRKGVVQLPHAGGDIPTLR
eukprot:2223249-Alexandrium_andersonii.AAC.1